MYAAQKKINLPQGNYFINIDTSFKKGSLAAGEIFIKGKSKKEIFFSTNICHPSMANNELSGPVLSLYLSEYINNNYKKTNYSYRFIFIPETIGSISYIHKNLKNMKKNIQCGFVLSCVGDNRCYSHIKSPTGKNLADKAIQSSFIGKKKLKIYDFKDRGSDERQYCSPNVDLPFCGFSRSKYGTYPEYHTSEDNFRVVTNEGLKNSFIILKDIVDSLETSLYPKTKIVCEPFLSKRNLMPSMRDKEMYKNKNQFILSNLIAYSNGKNSIFDLAILLNTPLEEVCKFLKILINNKIVS